MSEQIQGALGEKTKNDESTIVDVKDVKILPTIRLTIMQRQALSSLLEKNAKIQRDFQAVSSEILSAHGYHGDHVLNAIDLDAGIVQVLTREQAAEMSRPRQPRA